MAAPEAGQAWRIATHTTEVRADDLSGNGAKLTGGRWNSKGKAMVHAATLIALATLETLVHRSKALPIQNAYLVRIDILASVWRLRKLVQASELAVTWTATPPGPTTIEFGDAWIDSGATPILLVPSVIVPKEYDVLINPQHPASEHITATIVRQYIYDGRLYV